MTKGKVLSLLIHCAGVTLAMAIVLELAKTLVGAIPIYALTGAAVFYCAALAWVTVRVLNGKDAMANAAEDFLNGK